MTWAEFRAWALDVHHFRFPRYVAGTGAAWRAIWGVDGFHAAGSGTGTGHPAEYGPVQRRRFAVWLRARKLIKQTRLREWLAAGEPYDDGWLVDDGTGIRWVADPTDEWKDLIRSGFIAVKCGVGLALLLLLTIPDRGSVPTKHSRLRSGTLPPVPPPRDVAAYLRLLILLNRVVRRRSVRNWRRAGGIFSGSQGRGVLSPLWTTATPRHPFRIG